MSLCADEVREDGAFAGLRLGQIEKLQIDLMNLQHSKSVFHLEHLQDGAHYHWEFDMGLNQLWFAVTAKDHAS